MKKKNVSTALWRDLFPVMFKTEEYYIKIVNTYYEGYSLEQKLMALIMLDNKENAVNEFYAQIQESFNRHGDLDDNLHKENIDNFLSFVLFNGELELKKIPCYIKDNKEESFEVRKISFKEKYFGWFFN